jgi:hypothetical protein
MIGDEFLSGEKGSGTRSGSIGKDVKLGLFHDRIVVGCRGVASSMFCFTSIPSSRC